ncbi:MAG: GAF domain-containing protein [Actinobacteria bacterium]|nr:GAF domain-containing protein [Actinomycetota bacterium]MBW3644683.1 GAF domain-containing protein [Actinomycetota bacterium]
MGSTPFRPPITALRWGAVALGLVLAATGASRPTGPMAAGGLVLIGYATLRTARPIPLHERSLRTSSLAEAGLHLAVVAATGFWESPYVVSLLTAVVVVGFARGFNAALRIAAASAIALAVPYHLLSTTSSDRAVALTFQWSTELLLVAAIAGYARRFWVEVDERHHRDLDRIDRLAEANTLLTSLHEVAQALPTSLDLDQALDSVVARARTFCDLRTVVVLLPEDAGPGWTVARQSGARLPARFELDALPSPLVALVAAPARARRVELAESEGLVGRSRSALYVPLGARDQLVGLLALEHDRPRWFSARDAEVLDGFAEGAALALDNARRFGTLRTVSVDEERSRIAGQLHDHVGQSLACLAFEVDLLVRQANSDELRDGLEHLRDGLRSVIGDIRDTLSDLRTEVTEDRGLVETAEAFLARVHQRSGRPAVLHHGPCQRLPLAQERVLWRVLYETVNQSLRRGDCTVEAWWTCDGRSAELEVTTDVDGFDLHEGAPPGSWVHALREAAAGIGARVEIEELVEGAWQLRCSLAGSRTAP